MASVTSIMEGVSEEALAELRMQLRGQALMPCDPGYDQIRPPFNLMHRDRPALAVVCTGTADVADAVRFARAHGLEVTVRGGGHSVAGFSTCDGGMLIDLAPMNGVWVDCEASLAHVQGGALWADVDRETQPYGLATPGGTISDTGVAGLTLGGGYGWLRRKYGLASDNVVSFEVVGADGEVRIASADENPDLYWALRGGGGNFGIVTRFTFRLHPVGPIVAFAGVFYDVQDAPVVLRGLRDYLETAPDEVTPMALAITMPAEPYVPPPIHDRAVLVVGAVHAGGVDEGMSVLQPLRELATPIADISQPMPFRFVQSAFDPLAQRQTLHSYWKSTFISELSDAAIDVVAEGMQSRPQPLALVIAWPLGGEVNRVGEDESAYAERSAPCMVSVEANTRDERSVDSTIAWARETWSRIAKFGTGATYLNFTGLDDGDNRTGIDAAFGAKLERLAQIKARYDPDNFFHRNNNIVPAAWER